MQTIERKSGSFHDLVFTVDLTSYNKVAGDIADIIFLVKNSILDVDSLAIMSKKQSLAEITFTGEDIVSVLWDETEYGSFEINKVYKAGLFLKFTGDPQFDENVDTLFNLKITQDFVTDE